MDHQKQNNTINNLTSNLIAHPAHLLIGNENQLITHLESELQTIFCPKQGCKTCNFCKQILERQHNQLLWLCPEKNYTIDQLEPLFRTISFALENNTHFFFVLQKADFFNLTCANALLKILEEPPTGYHFILLAQRLDYILPTIRSRCLVQKFQSISQENEIHQLATWFKTLNFPDAATFSQKIDQVHCSERESIELLDNLLEFWSQQYTASLSDDQKKNTAARMVKLLQQAFEHPPMPGSSKLFWKDIYLRVRFA